MVGILERLAAGVVLGDGGYVLELERRGYIQAGPYIPEVAVDHPEALYQLHVEFRRAGAEVLQALTFYGGEDKLESAGRVSDAERINRAAVRLAREAAAGQALVAGVVTLSPSFIPGDAGARKRTRQILARQLGWICAEGVDFLVGETFIWLEEALLALEVMSATDLPVMMTMNVSLQGSREGISVGECAHRLAAEGASIVGVNCDHDPQAMLPMAALLPKSTGTYLACQPIGYRTSDTGRAFTDLDCFPLELDSRQLTRFELARFAEQARDAGVNYIGGCCGVVAHHIRAMAEALGRRPEASRSSPDLARHVLSHVRDRSATAAGGTAA